MPRYAHNRFDALLTIYRSDKDYCIQARGVIALLVQNLASDSRERIKTRRLRIRELITQQRCPGGQKRP